MKLAQIANLALFHIGIALTTGIFFYGNLALLIYLAAVVSSPDDDGYAETSNGLAIRSAVFGLMVGVMAKGLEWFPFSPFALFTHAVASKRRYPKSLDEIRSEPNVACEFVKPFFDDWVAFWAEDETGTRFNVTDLIFEKQVSRAKAIFKKYGLGSEWVLTTQFADTHSFVPKRLWLLT